MKNDLLPNAIGLAFTEESNRRYEAATPAQKRVIIALDGIAAIQADRLNVQTGYYFEPSYEVDQQLAEAHPDASLRDVLAKIDTSACMACAKGVVFSCVVARQNKVTVGEFNSMTGRAGRVNWDGAKMAEKLGGTFDAHTLRLMELEFEQGDQEADESWDEGSENYVERIKPVMRLGHLGAPERLIAILRNIVDNGGEFKPCEPDKKTLDQFYYEGKLPPWSPPRDRMELAVRVTKKDITQSNPRNAARCAVAVALRRALRARFRRWELSPTDIIVGVYALVTRKVNNKDVQVVRDRLPESVRKWTVAFDDSNNDPAARARLEPFEFTVSLLPTAFDKVT